MNKVLAIKNLYPNLTDKDFMGFDRWNWIEIDWYNTEIPQPTQEELELAWIEVEKLQQAEIIKEEKAKAIENIATITDQLNLIATVLDTITSENPDPVIINEAKAKFNEIKNILNNWQ